jgi:hypothetical protein
MKRLLVITTIALGVALSAGTATAAMTEAECEAAWKTADADNDGYITEAESARHFAALRVANKTVTGDRLARADFLNHCKVGLFTVSQIDAGAPLSGANSFTEGQAKDRAMAHGLMSVGPLKKDDNGVWRGPAMKDGKQVTIAVDYKGNVVAN